MDITKVLAEEFKINLWQVENTVALIDEGCTIPFIARYRKEKTGSLDDQLLRELFDRLTYLRNLTTRKEEVIRLIDEQGQLTDELVLNINNAKTLTEVEDIYRPFKPKKRTKATIAKEKGLEPLAIKIYLQNIFEGDILEIAKEYIDEEKEVLTAQDALEGAMHIIAENVSDNAEIRKKLRSLILKQGLIESKNSKEENSVFEMYYDYKEPVLRVAYHRVLAMDRGENEGVLTVKNNCPWRKCTWTYI